MYGRERDRWQLLIRQAIGRNMHCFPGHVAIQYDAYRVQLMDKDNHHGSFKLIGDALKNLGVILDDGPKIVDEDLSHYEQHRVGHHADQHIMVTIRALDDPAANGITCADCGAVIDLSKPFRLSPRGRALHILCYSKVNAELKGRGLGPLNMKLVEGTMP